MSVQNIGDGLHGATSVSRAGIGEERPFVIQSADIRDRIAVLLGIVDRGDALHLIPIIGGTLVQVVAVVSELKLVARIIRYRLQSRCVDFDVTPIGGLYEICSASVVKRCLMTVGVSYLRTDRFDRFIIAFPV